MEAAALAPPSFAVNTHVNEFGEATAAFCGDWVTSHRAACDAYALQHTVDVREKRELVIVSCGGFPHDINLIQAHKALEAASHVCADGGTIILVAECTDGLGRNDFLEWFAAPGSEALAEKLCQKYRVNGQTAWNLMRITERFQTKAVTALDDETLAKLRIGRETTPLNAGTRKGYILPHGAKFNYRISS
jgi:nickel-dependent lactate racemase